MFINDLNNIRDRFKALSADLAHMFVGGSPIAETAYRLGVDLDKAVERRTTAAYTENSEELEKLLEGTTACVEADRYAYHSLWRDYAIGAEQYGAPDHIRLEWKSGGMTSVVVGHIEDRPVNVSISFATIGGAKIMFYHGCSTVVDHDMIRNFLDIAMPASARRADGRINNHDADNFGNALPRRTAEAA